MPDTNTKYVVEFIAEMKELRKGLAELKTYQRQNQKSAKDNFKIEKSRSKERKKDFDDFQKKLGKQQKDEKKHHETMSREETRRHRANLKLITKSHQENLRLHKKTWDEQTRQERKLGGGGERTGFVRGSGMVAAGNLLARGVTSLWDFFTGAVLRGYQQYMQFQQTMGQNIGLGTGKSIRAGVRGAMGGRLGYSQIDTAGQVGAMARSTGVTGPRELQQAMRATGMDVGEAGGIFGVLRRAGIDFTGAGEKQRGTGLRSQSAGGKEFQKMIAGGMASGLERARLPEYFEGVSRLVEEAGGRTFGKVNVDSIMTQLGALGKTGMPGLQGSRGAGALTQILGPIAKPGGGEYGDAFMRQAFGFGKPGGTATYYQAEVGRERAARGEDPQAMMRVLGEVRGQFGGGDEGALALRELTNVSLDQAATLLKIFDSNQSMDDKQQAVKDEMEKSKPLEQQSLDMMKNIGGGVQRIAELTDRGIGAGAKAASAIEKVEDLQYELLVKIFEGIKVISDFVKDLQQSAWWRTVFGGSDPAKKPENVRDRMRDSVDQAERDFKLGSMQAFRRSMATARNAMAETTSAEFKPLSEMSDDEARDANRRTEALNAERERAARAKLRAQGALQWAMRRGIKGDYLTDAERKEAQQFGNDYAERLKSNFGSYSDVTSDAPVQDMFGETTGRRGRRGGTAAAAPAAQGGENVLGTILVKSDPGANVEVGHAGQSKGVKFRKAGR